MLENLQKMIPFNSEAQRKAAETLLELWQYSDSNHGADKYIRDVNNKVCQLYENRALVVKASDLPVGQLYPN